MAVTGKYYPRWDGHSTEKLDKFRMNQEYEVGDDRRYPIRAKFPFQVLVSFGRRRSTPENHLRINDNEGIANCIDKLQTKQLLSDQEIAVVRPFAKFSQFVNEQEKHFDVEAFEQYFTLPVLAKKIKGSRGEGMCLIKSLNDLAAFIQAINARGSMNKHEFYSYFFETAISVAREFRLHVSPLLVNHSVTYQFEYCPPNGQGQFVRQDRPRLEHNSDGLIFAIEKSLPADLNDFNPDDLTMTSSFRKPANWQEIVETAVAAVEAVGLDFGAVDMLLDAQGNYFVSEINSNPEFYTHPNNPCQSLELQAYQQAMKHIILKKAQKVGGIFGGVRGPLALNL